MMGKARVFEGTLDSVEVVDILVYERLHFIPNCLATVAQASYPIIAHPSGLFRAITLGYFCWACP